MERKSEPTRYEIQSRKRINQIISDFCNGSQQQLVEKTGVNKASISQYVNGKNVPSNITAKKIAAPFHLNPAWVMGFDVPMYEKFDLDLSKYDNIRPIGKQKLPVLGYIAAGEPIFMEELHEFDIENGEEIDADFILIAKGDSMIGARINSGDLVFIKQQPTVENGEIAAVAVDDEATLKRFYKYDDLVVLRSENPNYRDMEYKPEDGKEVRILGKAVAFQGKLV